jgi:hypothetical protein
LIGLMKAAVARTAASSASSIAFLMSEVPKRIITESVSP